jgi:hypothetical protein
MNPWCPRPAGEMTIARGAEALLDPFEASRPDGWTPSLSRLRGRDLKPVRPGDPLRANPP